eukprot:TRINITY_DN4513_c0_g1_i3.p1 TRINITY_DN4513_c0_g1~~TRINITY_DN4513_c0_g1_i3.p1  ORF type:complete len:1056 (-),score=197.17 TRINITY_DN4513_c0_g1_i3:173-3340(-)
MSEDGPSDSQEGEITWTSTTPIKKDELLWEDLPSVENDEVPSTSPVAFVSSLSASPTTSIATSPLSEPTSDDELTLESLSSTAPAALSSPLMSSTTPPDDDDPLSRELLSKLDEKSTSSSSIIGSTVPASPSIGERSISYTNPKRRPRIDEGEWIDGEEPLFRVPSVSLFFRSTNTEIWRSGDLIVTNYQLIYKPSEHSNAPGKSAIPSTSHLPLPILYIPVCLINICEHKTRRDGQDQIKLQTHDMRLFKITIGSNVPNMGSSILNNAGASTISSPLKSFVNLAANAIGSTATMVRAPLGVVRLVRSAEQVYDHISKVLNLMELRSLFAFSHKPSYPVDGWNIYDPVREFARMGIPSEHWSLSAANADLSICPTYPSVLCVPSTFDKDDLTKCAEFRSKGRIPVLCWKAPNSPATMTRCSQPQVGKTFNRSEDDERLVACIQSLNYLKDHLIVIDARPRVNAMAQQAGAEGGTESAAKYKFCNIHFMGIENIHNVRDAMGRLFKSICGDRSKESWLLDLEGSLWMKYIRAVLVASVDVATYMAEGHSVMIHCSDGWDRTAQITSLAQIMLDPYYRSMKGFAVLVEKEWVSFGHKFAERAGHRVNHRSNSTEKSPIFVQFLDSVSQLLKQFPTHFEFGQNYLIALADSVYNCRFGTFLSDTQADMINLRADTVSVWSWLLSHTDAFRNVYYDEQVNARVKLIIPSTTSAHLQFWHEFYFRYHSHSNANSNSTLNISSGWSTMAPAKGDKARNTTAVANGYMGTTPRILDKLPHDILDYARLIPEPERRMMMMLEKMYYIANQSTNGSSISVAKPSGGGSGGTTPIISSTHSSPLSSSTFTDSTSAASSAPSSSNSSASSSPMLSSLSPAAGARSVNFQTETTPRRPEWSPSFFRNRTSPHQRTPSEATSLPMSPKFFETIYRLAGLDYGQHDDTRDRQSVAMGSPFSLIGRSSPLRESKAVSPLAFRESMSVSDRTPLPSAPPQWIRDSWSAHCADCGKPFSQVRRKHHCRGCGMIFCGGCSRQRVAIPRYEYHAPVRVCDHCFARVESEIAPND